MEQKYIYILHSNFDKLAGTERVLVNIIQHMTQEGWKIKLILTGENRGQAMSLPEKDVDVIFLSKEIRVNSVSKLSIMTNMVKILIALRRSVFSKTHHMNSKAVLLGSNVFYAAVLHLASNRDQVLGTISCEHFAMAYTGYISKIFRKIFYSKFHVIALTELDKEVILRDYRPLKAYCIPNAIPFDDVDRTYNIESKIILAIGRISHQKGFDLLIHSFAKIAQQNPTWTLRIVGDDYGERHTLEKLINDYQLNNVEILEATPNIQEIYQSASFYVMSSRFEGLPMVLLEAISFGLPIVSFDCPTGPKQIVGTNNGILVAPEDISGLATGMSTLIGSIEQRVKYSDGAKQLSKNFSKKNINRLWTSLFEQFNSDKSV